jgi:hypothetical protein
VILDFAGRPDGVEIEMVVSRSWLDIVLDPSDKVSTYIFRVVGERACVCIDFLHNFVEELLFL